MPSDDVSGAGAMYFPASAYNTYQTWRFYNNTEIERDLQRAASLGLDSIRVFLNYEWWYMNAVDDTTANPHLANLTHFMNTAEDLGIGVLPVLFESIGDDPGDPIPGDDTAHGFNVQRLENQNIDSSFAVHSPSRRHVIQPEDWTGWFGSPEHFTRRITNHLGGHPALEAIEVMNEPGYEGGAPKRFRFAVDMANVVRETNPTVPITMGCKDFGFQGFLGNRNYNKGYEEQIDGGLDIHQFHANIVKDAATLRDYMQAAGQYSDDIGKPVWCTEWQRLQTEPPNVYLPDYDSAASIIFDAHRNGDIDGSHLWGLMFKPAYIRKPRQQGRLNGIFHEDGSVFKRSDARAIAEGAVDREERYEYPNWIRQGQFPWPKLEHPGGASIGTVLALGLGVTVAGYYLREHKRDDT